ncbi:hypothetical protein SDRG_00387 [Saprolegnia diclina VS20]|uniref:Uncharacterized protein n=1 Tax=Saprolegnia diclina (strain VS20) TaxID=1156394 RepID=T0QWP9_SAPDV|nr:hypothetical protein SDRG_00387 [Saprolegnia diclina VS20]EQC42659.1 hypothetical protein SDRG_00387 [Saprolegnia diclina VS20]|eukprot:XP_008604082.1 hypothetical protein SDRG_00387 [Saprolegnia diclina VS20]
MADPKPRLNPMELKRQRLAKRLKAEPLVPTPTAEKPLPTTTPEKPLPAAAVADSPAMDIEARMKSIYAKTRIEPSALRNTLGVQYPTTLETRDELPWDWTLKTKLSCMTSFPFPPRVRAAGAARSFERFHNGANSDENMRPDERWYAGLHQYVHPASGLPNQAEGGHDDDFVSQRLRDWQDAFRSLYYAFHHTPTHRSFYLVTPQFVVCFYRQVPSRDTTTNSFRASYALPPAPSPVASSSPQGVRHGIAAVISHSTSSFRRELVANGIVFSTPFSRTDGHAQVQGDAALLKELHALSKVDAELKRATFTSPTPSSSRASQSSTNGKAMRGADSLLLFHDPDNVHGLYDFLLNQQPTGALDVPTIYAAMPFQHASAVPLKVTSRGSVKSAQSPTERYKIEVDGVLLPETHRRLTLAIAAAAGSDGTVDVHHETFPASSRLNVCGFDLDVQNLAIWLETHGDEIELTKRHLQSVHYAPDTGFTCNVQKS